MKRKTLQPLIMLLILVIFASCKTENQNDGSKSSPAFMNMKPTEIPVLLYPELIASSLDEYNGTFSPDGKAFFFTTNTPIKGIICHTSLSKNNKWSAPKVAGFSGAFSDYDPLFSPDGKRLYFSSERPVDENDSSEATSIWYVDMLDSIWSAPKRLDINLTGTFYSSITNEGHIYFNMWDTGDMYKAVSTNEGYQIDTLPEVLNSSKGEGDPFISPDEDYIIFRGYNNSLGSGDLYISYMIDSNWTDPENLGEPINSQAHEMCPYVTVDGKYFIFSSSRMSGEYPSIPNESIEEMRATHQSYDNGQLNIYYMSTTFIQEKRKKYE